jgi:hypothetical protein
VADENLGNQIETARNAGYGDDEIISHLAGKDPRFRTAIEAGHQPSDILAHFLTPPMPSFDSPEFDSAIAQKHGVSPEFIANLKRGASVNAAVEGIPIAGAYAPNAGAALSALSGAYPAKGAPGETYSERYEKNLGVEREVSEAFRRAHPIGAAVDSVVGSGLSLGAAGTTALGARALGVIPGAGLGTRMAAGAASGGAIGGADAAARGGDVGTGAAIGAGLGGALPAVGRVIGAAASPIVNQLSARFNPQGYAERQVARAIMESGQTPTQIGGQVAQAGREGQPMFTPADAMGNAGQRMLSTVARAPGEGRQVVNDFLEARQAGQGRRVAGQLAEGFQSPQTAQQVEAGMTGARDAAANAEYTAARHNAGAVDVTPVIWNIDATLQPGVNQIARPPSNIANDTIERALESIRARLTDNRSNLTDFTALQRVRGDLADMTRQADRAGQGNRARLLGGVLRQLDQQMEQASPGFLQANRNFAQASRNIEAVGEGRTAATRGRAENTIPAFQRLTPEGQQGYRAGYVDPLIEQVQGAPVGTNKARQFTSDAFQREAEAMAPGAPRLARQLGRENTMFATGTHALGGSRTADNLADSAAMGVDPSMIGHVLSGNIPGALRAAMGSISNGITGNTPAVRRAVADILLARNLPPAEFQRMLDQTTQRITQVQQTAQRASRTLGGMLTLQANMANGPAAPPTSPLARTLATSAAGRPF